MKRARASRAEVERLALDLTLSSAQAWNTAYAKSTRPSIVDREIEADDARMRAIARRAIALGAKPPAARRKG